MRNSLTLFVLLVLFISCNRHQTVSEAGGTIIECEFLDVAENGETETQILDILKKRARYISPDAFVAYDHKTLVYHIEIPGVVDLNASQLLSCGQMNICETYRKQDIIGMQVNPIFDSLIIAYPLPLDIVGYSSSALLFGLDEAEMPKIDSLLSIKGVREGLPCDLKFSWSRNKEGSKGYSLFMIKDTSANVDLSATHESSSIEKDKNGHGEFISISLDKNGARRFSELTERNIMQTLAITADDRTLSTPMVQQRIEGGKMQISGNFEKTDTTILLALLNTKRIKSNAELVSVEVVPLKK